MTPQWLHGRIQECRWPGDPNCSVCTDDMRERARRLPFNILRKRALPKVAIGVFLIALSALFPFIPFVRGALFAVGATFAAAAGPDLHKARRLRREHLVREVMTS